MAPGRSEKLDRAKHRIYLRRAMEFHDAMERALEQQAWSAVGLTAVHTVISAADALTTFYLGERSRGEDHGEVAALLERVPLPEAPEKAAQATRVLALKNRVEYEAREFEAGEARDAAKRASRFFQWALGHLG